MHALTILHRCVGPLLVGIHRRRLAVLFDAVAATVSGSRLTLTEYSDRIRTPIPIQTGHQSEVKPDSVPR